MNVLLSCPPVVAYTQIWQGVEVALVPVHHAVVLLDLVGLLLVVDAPICRQIVVRAGHCFAVDVLNPIERADTSSGTTFS